MISYTFDTDAQGWTITGGTEAYMSGGGDPGGYVQGTDGDSNTWYYVSPTSLAGDRSSLFGGTLAFDLFQSDTTSPFTDSDVILKGGGLTLVATLPAPPGTDWTHYAIDFAVGTWRVGSASGNVASQAQLLAALGSLTELDIRGEFHSGDDHGGLDNVVLTDGTAPPPVTSGYVTSTFDTGTESWSFLADVAQFSWQPSGGNPGGFLQAVDAATGDVWYFVAPQKFLGDQSATYGGTLSFDLEQSSQDNQFEGAADVIISGGGISLYLDFPDPHPGLSWTHYIANLDTSAAWHVGSLTGTLATESDIRQVLASVTAIDIRGEFVSGPDTGGLDNVVLKAGNVIPGTDAGETLTGTGGDDTMYGFGGNDTINALAGNDLIDGGTGADTMTGGDGNDTYYVDNAGDRVIEASAGGGNDLVYSSVSYNLAGQYVETLTLTGSANISATGNTQANVLVGNSGANVLNGLAGADTMTGGDGNDTYYVDNAGDSVIEQAGGGTDEVRTTLATYYLAANVEALTGTASSSQTLTGNALDNVITAGAAGDRLDGGDGNDTLYGGDGNDTLRGGGAGLDMQYGGAGNDILVVDRASDIVAGEVYDGGSGNDTLILNFNMDGDLSGVSLAGIEELDQSYFGYDTRLTAAQLAALTTLSGQSFTLTTGGTVSLSGKQLNLDVINLSNVATSLDLTGATHSYTVTVNGGTGRDAITGTADGDVLNGGGGVDTLTGGAGNDTYYVDNSSDKVIEGATGGTDIVYASASYNLAGQYIETLTLTGTAGINATGNSQANTLNGNSGANVLDGLGGADRMTGGDGNDTYYVDNVNDRVIEASATGGNDIVYASVSYNLAGQFVETLTLTGSAAINATGNTQANTLVGNGAANVLNGGAGSDTLTGGAGADTFAFNTALGASNIDTITDFTVGQDLISLDRAIFSAIASSGALSASAFGTGTAATTADQRILYDSATGNLWYDKDGNGSAAAVRFATVAAGLSLTAGSFTVV